MTVEQAAPSERPADDPVEARSNPWLLATVGLVALLWGAAILIARERMGAAGYHASAVFTAWAFVAAGLCAWALRPNNRTGRIMVVGGLLSLAPALQATYVPLPFTVGTYLSQAPGVVFVYLVLAYPRGRLATVPERFVLFLAVLTFAFDFAGTFFYDPRDLACPECPPGLNLLLVSRDVDLLRVFLRLTGFASLAAAASLFALLVVRTARATAPARRIVWPVYLPTLVLTLDRMIGGFYFWVLLRPQVFPAWFVTVETIVRLLLPVAFVLGLLRLRLRRSRVGDLIVDLGHRSDRERLRDAVAHVLGDDSVEVGFYSDRLGRYVTPAGQPLALPSEGGARTATFLERDATPLAVIVHDQSLRDDPKLLDAVAAAARMAVENERLQAEVRAQLEEVRTSRARIVEAADAERRRIERDLHDGAQQRLVALSIDLRMAEGRAASLGDHSLADTLGQAADDLRQAVAELRQLAQGIHPGVLDEGLDAALEELAERSPIPVRVSVTGEHPPAPVASTVYFLICEALANAAKHSFASEVAVRVNVGEGSAEVVVEDDGIGGADASLGSGLRGLDDRVASVDGSLDFLSPPGRGTRLTARIPCASSLPTTQS